VYDLQRILNQFMETLTPLLESATTLTAEYVHEQRESDGFREGFEQYLSFVEPAIETYEHHLGNNITNEQLQKRYEYETSLLHVLTSIFSYDVKQDFVVWPVTEPDSPYKWFQPPSGLSVAIEDIITALPTSRSRALAVSHASGQVLDKTSKRYLGEFYTPLPIVKHLIDLSGLKERELLEGYRIIDPACGGGIILTAIADRVISHAEEREDSPESVLQSLSQNMYGFDIQPAAIYITRSLLIYKCLRLLEKCDQINLSPLFPNIKLQDALLTYDQYLSRQDDLFQHLPNNKGFHYIIGNPPFMSVKGKNLHFLKHYEDVISGHPNLYQLFLWWAVCAAIKGGVVSFLLPQTMLAGAYSRKLRAALEEQTNVTSITRMTDRKGVVGDVDQQMMVVCLKVDESKPASKSDSAEPDEANVNVRITRNGSELSKAKPRGIKHSRIAQRVGESSVSWVVSDNILDYTICERLEKQCLPLVKLNKFSCGNGGYVWNQNKELLSETYEDNSLPLISAASIELYGFNFPYAGSHASRKRLFSCQNKRVEKVMHSRPALLVQRTTPRKVGRRLIVGMPSDKFYIDYPRYFLENHINYIKVLDDENINLLYGLMGWLNSDLINFVFQLRNGNTHVSAFELGLFPVNLEMVEQLVDLTKDITNAETQERNGYIEILNKTLYDWLHLGPRHRSRIADVLNRKDKGGAYV
jgi:adenine-specific DNA-methyltransferase